MPISTIITFMAYLIILLGIGIVAFRATTSTSDYILGGRKMGPAVTALSVGASDMSGWLLLGLPGAVYVSGLSEAWIGLGLLVGAWLNWLLVAKRLRVYTEYTNDSLTLPDFFERRFNDQSGLLRLVAASTTLLFFIFYTSSGLVGGAFLFEQVFGLDYSSALLIGAAIIVSYTFIGGFFAVSWTDFFQGILMLLALLLIPAVVFSNSEFNHSHLAPETLQLLPASLSIFSIVSLCAWGLGYFGQPHILSRFMAISGPQAIPRARFIAMFWMVLALIGALATGMAGMLVFNQEPLANAEMVFIELTKVLFNPWIAGILVAAILSAIMSTIDSQLLVCSSVVTEDFYHKWVNPNASEKQRLWVGRITVAVVAIVAIIIAFNPESSVLALVSYAWAGFGAAFGPTILLALYWRNYSRQGAICTILVGALVVVIWKQLNGGWFDMYELLPGFLLATLAGVIASVIWPVEQQVVERHKQFELTL